MLAGIEGGTQRERDPSRDRPLEGGRREGRRRHGGRDAPLGARVRSAPASRSPSRGRCGSVSGGCVESDVYENAQEVLATGEPKLLSHGIEDDLAWSVGLPCGGEIDVFLERVE